MQIEDFQASLIKRNQTLHNSRPLDGTRETIKEEDYFNARRPSRLGDENEEQLERLKSDILSTKNRIKTLNTQN